jgi:hypothetical protein
VRTLAVSPNPSAGTWNRDDVILFDALARTLEVLRLENDRWSIVTTCADQDAVHAEPFAALEIDLSLLWE